jgi:hypothetical protein
MMMEEDLDDALNLDWHGDRFGLGRLRLRQ